MCQLELVHYACGCSFRKLLSPCKSALRFGPVPKNRVPDLCLGGLKVENERNETGDCHIGTSKICHQLPQGTTLKRDGEGGFFDTLDTASDENDSRWA